MTPPLYQSRPRRDGCIFIAQPDRLIVRVERVLAPVVRWMRSGRHG